MPPTFSQSSDPNIPYSSPASLPGVPPEPPKLKSFGVFFSEALREIKEISYVLVPLGLLLFLLQAVLPAFLGFLPQAIDAILSFPVALASFLFYFLAPIIILQTIALNQSGGRLEFREAINRGFGVLFPYGIVLFIAGIIRFGAFVPFIIPGIIVAVFLALVEPAAAIEGRRGFDALARSWALVRGSGWSVFGRLLLLWLILIAVAVLLVLPVFLVTIGLTLWGGYQATQESGGVMDETTFFQQFEGQLAFPQLIFNTWASAVGIAVLFFTFAFDFVLFRNLVAIKGDVVDVKKGKFYALLVWGILAGIILVALFLLLIVFAIMQTSNPSFFAN